MRQYIAIDLKSFYASVECRELGLDPLTTNLVVADVSRTEKTICLAVSPSLKAYGISGRARLFEVIQRVGEVNRARLRRAGAFSGKSCDAAALAADPALELDYIAAVPRMSLYMEYSTRIYQIYLRYIAPEDIHVYSIDEVFIDATEYLATYQLTAHELAIRMVREVLRETGITATAGIGTNLYLAKIAMDVMAKKAQPDADGVRLAQLDEMSYRRQLWGHRPLTDFWRVGRGTAKRLESAGMYTMGDVARCSVEDEEILYRMFGVNAELLIDHAWGWEPCTIDLVKAYVPDEKSFSYGQVLMEPYDFSKARVIVHEMADAAALALVEKRMCAEQVVLTISYESLDRQQKNYQGEVTVNRYGRKVPKHAHGTQNLGGPTSAGSRIVNAALQIYDRTVDPSLLIRFVSLALAHVSSEKQETGQDKWEQLSLFTNEEDREKQEEKLEKERQLQETMITIKKKYGKNAILKGVNFEEGATGRERNRQVGGHKA